MKHKFSKEIIYHFNCGKCNKWWSIADYHLLSLDNLKNLHTWKKYDKILTEHLLYIYPRPGISVSMQHKNIVFFEKCPKIDISASFIRVNIKKKKDISYLIPEKAWNYIDEMNFYRF